VDAHGKAAREQDETRVGPLSPQPICPAQHLLIAYYNNPCSIISWMKIKP
jgi:hypothetical protein